MEPIGKPDDACAIAAKVVQAMRAPFDLSGISVRISTSIGLAFCHGGTLSTDALRKLAEVQL